MTVVFASHGIEQALFPSDRILMLSKRPARIVADIRVPLARPRRDETTVDPLFIDIKLQCLALLREAG
jgi:NitT/TauT family transport system ATP-binding protein